MSTVERTELELPTRSGLVLRADAYGDPTARTVVLVHGGGQTRHSWGGTARALAEAGWYAVAYDHFLELCPHAEFVDVSGAGHMVAGDRNDAFSSAVVDFLASLD